MADSFRAFSGDHDSGEDTDFGKVLGCSPKPGLSDHGVLMIAENLLHRRDSSCETSSITPCDAGGDLSGVSASFGQNPHIMQFMVGRLWLQIPGRAMKAAPPLRCHCANHDTSPIAFEAWRVIDKLRFARSRNERFDKCDITIARHVGAQFGVRPRAIQVEAVEQVTSRGGIRGTCFIGRGELCESNLQSGTEYIGISDNACCSTDPPQLVTQGCHPPGVEERRKGAEI